MRALVLVTTFMAIIAMLSISRIAASDQTTTALANGLSTRSSAR
jgi:hypothetical protein